MICVNLSAVDIIHLQSNNFVMDMKIKTTGESKLNSNPAFLSTLREWLKDKTETLTSKNRSPCFNCSYTTIESLSL